MGDERAGGRCLCGEVRYEATGPLGAMWYCHCRDCRKAGGVGFGAWVEAPGLRWVCGESRVQRFAPSTTLTRAHCTVCGTVLPVRRSCGDVLLPAGGLDSLGGRRPCGHAAAEERLPWLPALDEGLPVLRMPCSSAGTSLRGSSRQAMDGPARGSCLCGAIAYEVDRPLTAMRVCHCSRCRRRSGSNWFVGLTCPADALRFLRGEDAIVTWHMPGTRYYTVSFCGVCGAAAPARLSRATFLSAGCMDDDPGTRALCHIHYESRAPWVDVRDGLPRFEESAPPDFDWQVPRP